MNSVNSIMKPKSALCAFVLAGSIAAMLAHLAAPSAQAVTHYWDNNGTTAGFGTAAGTWAAPTTGDATQGWSTSATGVLVPGSVTTGTADILNFGNGATGLAAGTITVSGTVDAGDMTFASGSGAIVLSGGTINLAAAETITVNNTTDTISSILAGAATSLTKAGTGTLILSGINTYTGLTNVSAGTLTISDASTFTNTSAINLSGTGRLNVNVADQSLAKLASDLDLSGTNGGTFLPNVSLALYDSVGTQTFTYTGTITPANNTYRFGGARAGNNINLTVANALTGARDVVVNGGNLRLMASMNYTGNTTINAGTFTIAGPVAALNAATGNGQIGGGNYAGAIINNGAVAHSSIFDQTLSDVISGTGSVTKTFATFTGGTSGTTSTLTLSGANTYTGVTSAQAGTLAFNSIANVSGGSSALGAPTTAANGTIAVGTTTTDGGIKYTGTGHTSNRVINLAGTIGGATIDASGSGPLVLTSAMTATGAGSKTLTLTGTNTGANTIGGAIVNNSAANITSLVKTGAGTWVLTGASTYTGATNINAGTLRLDYSTNNTGKINDSAVLAFGFGAFTITGGAVAATGTIVTNNPVIANGDFSIAGTGRLTLGDITLKHDICGLAPRADKRR